MKTKKKALLITMCAVLLVVATIFGTMAYLTSRTGDVVNTFTVGNVAINLDESDGKGGRTKEGNEYILIPGDTCAKDPTVTVLGGSEECYVRVQVKITSWYALAVDYGISNWQYPTGSDLSKVFAGWDEATWILQQATYIGYTDTLFLEFWYANPVSAPTVDVALTPLFTGITWPATLGNNVATPDYGFDMTITAHAIQAAGFADAAAAWAKF